MGALTAARSALAGLTASERPTSVQIKRAGTVSSPTGGTTTSWDSPTTVATVNARFQPASAEALERAGLLGLVNAQTAHLEDTNLTPETHRLYVGSTVYRVRSVSRWEGSHVEAIVEVHSA